MLAVVKSVNFLNIWSNSNKIFAIWLVDTLEASGESRFCFVTQELLGHDKKILSQELSDSDHHVSAGKEFMQWEMALRAQNHVLSQLMLYSGFKNKVFELDLKDSNIVKASPLDECTGFTPFSLSPGYLYCQTKLVKKEVCNEENNSFEVESLDIFIKTKAGTYSYCTDDANEASGAKKPRSDESLQILDIFVPATYTVCVGGQNVATKLARPIFDYLVINDDCKWNRGLIVFWGALYKKIYSNYYGLKPSLQYLFPTLSEFDLCPHFPSFPHVPMVFSSDFKDARLEAPAPTALLSLKNKQINNFLLECVFKCSIPPVPSEIKCAVGILWPFGATEINHKLMTGTSGSIVNVTDPHTLHVVSFNLRGVPERRSFSHWLNLKLWATFSTEAPRASLNTWYSCLVYSVMNFCNLHGLTWMAFHRNAFYLISKQQEVSYRRGGNRP